MHADQAIVRLWRGNKIYGELAGRAKCKVHAEILGSLKDLKLDYKKLVEQNSWCRSTPPS